MGIYRVIIPWLLISLEISLSLSLALHRPLRLSRRISKFSMIDSMRNKIKLERIKSCPPLPIARQHALYVYRRKRCRRVLLFIRIGRKRARLQVAQRHDDAY